MSTRELIKKSLTILDRDFNKISLFVLMGAVKLYQSLITLPYTCIITYFLYFSSMPNLLFTYL